MLITTQSCLVPLRRHGIAFVRVVQLDALVVLVGRSPTQMRWRVSERRPSLLLEILVMVVVLLLLHLQLQLLLDSVVALVRLSWKVLTRTQVH